MREGTIFAKFAAIVLFKKLAGLRVPLRAITVIAHFQANFIDMVSSAMGEELTEAKLIELADGFDCCHFEFLFLKLPLIF